MADATGTYHQQWVTRRIDPAVVHTIVEVGAYNGMDALALSQRYGARTYCFECNPAAIEECKRNLTGHPDVELVEKAVSDENGVVDFYPVPVVNPGASSIFQAVSSYQFNQTHIQVEATRLDTWMQKRGIETIDLLCIDAQGATLKILRGMGPALRSVSYIVAEVEVQRIYEGESLLLDVRAYLEDNGFKLVDRQMCDATWGDFIFENRICGPLRHLLGNRGVMKSERNVEWPFVLSRTPLPVKPRALDVGCCENDFAGVLATLGYEVCGVDLNPYGHPLVHFIREDARRMSFSDDTFDLVTSVSAIEHVGLVVTPYHTDTEHDEDGDLKVFNEMVRVAKPGGAILLTIPYGLCADHTNPFPATSTLWIRFYDAKRVEKLLSNELFILDEMVYSVMDDNEWRTVTEDEARTHLTTDRVSTNLCIRGHKRQRK